MIAETVRFVLTHVPLIMFVLAVLIAAITARQATAKAEHWLGWLLLLPVGADALWAGLFHVLMPHTAASFIGWQVSPFQFEVGVADIALGVAAIVVFWRPLEFKAGVVVYAVIFYVGVVYGHIHEAVAANNFAAGNVGTLLVLSIVRPILLTALLIAASRRAQSFGGPLTSRA
jgi:uncharacterized membrane protein